MAKTQVNKRQKAGIRKVKNTLAKRVTRERQKSETPEPKENTPPTTRRSLKEIVEDRKKRRIRKSETPEPSGAPEFSRRRTKNQKAPDEVPESLGTPGVKMYKDFTVDEKREYHKMKAREYRAKKLQMKQMENPEAQEVDSEAEEAPQGLRGRLDAIGANFFQIVNKK